LTPEQRQELQEQVRRQLNYLGRLQQRMQRVAWADDVYHAVVDAYNAVHALRVKLHYASCDAARRDSERAREGRRPKPSQGDRRPGERPAWMNSYAAGEP